MKHIFRSIFIGILSFIFLYIILIASFLMGNAIGRLFLICLSIISGLFIIYLSKNDRIAKMQTFHDLTLTMTVLILLISSVIVFGKDISLAKNLAFNISEFGNFIFIFYFSNFVLIAVSASFARIRALYNRAGSWADVIDLKSALIIYTIVLMAMTISFFVMP